MHLKEHGGKWAAGGRAGERGRFEDGVLQTAERQHTAGWDALQPLQPLAHHQVQPMYLSCTEYHAREKPGDTQGKPSRLSSDGGRDLRRLTAAQQGIR